MKECNRVAKKREIGRENVVLEKKFKSIICPSNARSAANLRSFFAPRKFDTASRDLLTRART